MLVKLPQKKIDYSSSTIECEARRLLYIDDRTIEYCQKTITETLLILPKPHYESN